MTERAPARGRGTARALAVVLAGFAAGDAAAAQPRTAIPWLSDSVEAPAPPAAPRARPRGRNPDASATITVTPLDPIRRDAVGLLPPATTGLPRSLWKGLTASQVASLLIDHPDLGPPAARAVFRRLLLAEADPPEGPDPRDAALLARIDRLLDLGALDEAEALLIAAGPQTPDLFRRWFDIGLLTNRATEQCDALRQNPALSPTLPVRVFCLARGGDWNAAEITLTLGGGVGSITPDQEALLARFLDPVVFEGEPDPPVPRPLTPLDFALREAVGLPRPSGGLPRAFLWSDLDEHTPMRMRIGAAERLMDAGAIDAATLLDAYRTGAPAASGGVWDRARAVQALDAALLPGAEAPLGEALAVADAALSAHGLRTVFARGYADQFAALEPAQLPPPVRVRLAELLLLAGDTASAARAAGPAPDARLASLFAIADAPRAAGTAAGDPRAAAALGGLAVRPPSTPLETRLIAAIDGGAAGPAVLEALDLLAPGSATDPASLETALYVLAAAGQRAEARAIALQTLLAPNDG